jgi:dTDP-4-amino-4,6-dideoxygalactose transaminase
MARAKTKKTIPLFDLKLNAATKRLVRRTLDSGWLSTGPNADEFEKAIARLSGVRYAVAVSSATAGLELALRAVNARQGVEVITTPLTFAATAAAIMRTGARPIFADIDPVTLNIDSDEIERKLSTTTLAIMPVDIAGHPCDYPKLAALCDRYRLPLIADAAHSVGASVGRKSVAAFADVAVNSFYSTKNLTCGEGGMVLTRHKQFAEAVRLLSRQGMTRTAHERRKKSSRAYDIRALGMKANLSDVHAAIGLGQLTSFENDQAKRRKIAERYFRNLAALQDIIELPFVADNAEPSWHLFIIKLRLSRLKIDRDRFIRLMAARSVECGVHYQGMFDLSYYRTHLGLSPQFFPNAAWATRRVVSLPIYPTLPLKDVDYICDCVVDVLTRHCR